MRKLKPYFILLLGTSILSFGIYNIHNRCAITEGGELGIELLLLHWFNISPAISALILDIIFYSLAFFVFGIAFVKYAAASTVFYSATYAVWSCFPPLLPDLSAYPFFAAVLAAIFVGIGVGLVVRIGGACSSDDALALVISKKFNIKIEFCYLFTDLSVLLVSLSYIPIKRIIWSLLTVCLSSWIIGKIQRAGEAKNN